MKNNLQSYKKELSKFSKKELIDIILSNDVKAIDADILVPSCVFSQDVPPLEGLVKFLIETKKLTIKETASRLNRNFKTIWTTYDHVKQKKLKLEYSEYVIPLSTFSKTNLSVLESLTGYLLQKGLSISGIAKILHKNVRTVWTCYSRLTVKKSVKNSAKNSIFSGGKK